MSTATCTSVAKLAAGCIDDGRGDGVPRVGRGQDVGRETGHGIDRTRQLVEARREVIEVAEADLGELRQTGARCPGLAGAQDRRDAGPTDFQKAPPSSPRR